MKEGTPYTIPKEPAGWRSFALAVLVHLALLALLWIGVRWQNETPTAVEAEIWSPQAQQAAPKPQPEPEAAQPPPPPPPPRVVEAPKPQPAPPVEKPVEKPVPNPDIALEQEKKRKLKEEKERREREEEEREERAEQKKLAQQKQEQAEARRKELAKAEAEKERRLEAERERKLELQAAQKREAEEERKRELAEAHKKELAKAEAEKKRAAQAKADAEAAEQRRIENLSRMTAQATGSGGSGQAAHSQGPSRADAGYAAKVGGKIRSNTVFNVPEELANNPAVEYAVDLLPDGSVRSIRKIKGSGVPGFDEAVKRAIEKSQPFPPDQSGRAPSGFTVSHKPKDQ
jgi:colicin import membrane protein